MVEPIATAEASTTGRSTRARVASEADEGGHRWPLWQPQLQRMALILQC